MSEDSKESFLYMPFLIGQKGHKEPLGRRALRNAKGVNNKRITS
jgi:hypothetical protein